MALKKIKEVNGTGVFVDYWKITHINFDYEEGVTKVYLAGYKDAVARTAGKKYITNDVCVFRSGFDLTEMSAKNPVALSYEKIKENVSFFKNAEDV